MTTLTEMLIADEGLELKPYRCTANKLTIGVGRNLEDTGITRDEALYLLNNDIKRVEAALMSNGTFNALDDARKMAIINMAFQLGVRGCFNFKRMWAALARRDWKAAHDEALDSNWARQTPNRARRIATILQTGSLRGVYNVGHSQHR